MEGKEEGRETVTERRKRERETKGDNEVGAKGERKCYGI